MYYQKAEALTAHALTLFGRKWPNTKTYDDLCIMYVIIHSSTFPFHILHDGGESATY